MLWVQIIENFPKRKLNFTEKERERAGRGKGKKRKRGKRRRGGVGRGERGRGGSGGGERGRGRRRRRKNSKFRSIMVYKLEKRRMESIGGGERRERTHIYEKSIYHFSVSDKGVRILCVYEN